MFGIGRRVRKSLMRKEASTEAPVSVEEDGALDPAEAIVDHIAVAQNVLEFRNLLAPFRVVGRDLARFGKANDGGYIMIDDLQPADEAFSFGIGDDDSWDVAVMATCRAVYQFDPTVAQAPTAHHKLHFTRVALSSVTGPDEISLDDAVGILTKAETDVIVKIDVEGAEWSALLAASSLARARQIVVEFHALGDLASALRAPEMLDCIRKIRETHVPVHIHANNHTGWAILSGVPIPETIEATFARKTAYEFMPVVQEYPTALDMACNPLECDLYLGLLASR